MVCHTHTYISSMYKVDPETRVAKIISREIIESREREPLPRAAPRAPAPAAAHVACGPAFSPLVPPEARSRMPQCRKLRGLVERETDAGSL